MTENTDNRLSSPQETDERTAPAADPSAVQRPAAVDASSEAAVSPEEIYAQAMALLPGASDVAGYEEVLSLLSYIPGYRDADEIAARLSALRRESLYGAAYDYAEKLLADDPSEEQLQKALALYSRMEDYRDVDQKAAQCESKLAEIRAQRDGASDRMDEIAQMTDPAAQASAYVALADELEADPLSDGAYALAVECREKAAEAGLICERQRRAQLLTDMTAQMEEAQTETDVREKAEKLSRIVGVCRAEHDAPEFDALAYDAELLLAEAKKELAYRDACAAMEKAETSEQCAAAEAAFLKLTGYRDALEKANACAALAEEKRKEALYYEAERLKNEGDRLTFGEWFRREFLRRR